MNFVLDFNQFWNQSISPGKKYGYFFFFNFFQLINREIFSIEKHLYSYCFESQGLLFEFESLICNDIFLGIFHFLDIFFGNKNQSTYNYNGLNVRIDSHRNIYRKFN